MSRGVRVLCVDDEPRVLDGLENHLAMHYDCHLADNGSAGLETLERDGPFSVVISDMRMPGMDGATFLAKARMRFPQTVRMLLTGYADVDAASQAVNHGQVFRFLQKPCAPKVLLEAVDAAVRHHQLLQAENELLENTFNGALKMLVDVLQVTAPEIFSRSVHVKSIARHISRRLRLSDRWHIETAALLAQIGCITVPSDVLTRHQSGAKLSPAEKEMLRRHPHVGQELLANVPRLETAARIIGSQGMPIPDEVSIEPLSDDQRIHLGVTVLRLASAADALISRGATTRKAMERLKKTGRYPLTLVVALEGYAPPAASVRGSCRLPLKDLRPGMMLTDDVVSLSGSVVVTGGRTLDSALLQRLRNFAAGGGVVEPISVNLLEPAGERTPVAVSLAPTRTQPTKENA